MSFEKRIILGCFVAGLEYSSGIEAECIGKPEETFFHSALEHMNDAFKTDLTCEGRYLTEIIILLSLFLSKSKFYLRT